METIPEPILSDTESADLPGKADLGKRFGAYLIDALLAGLIAYILGLGGFRMYGLGMLAGAGYILLRDGLQVEFMHQRSLGKKLLKLRPVRLDGSPMTIDASLRRNWPMALPTALYGLGALLGGYGGFFAITALAGIAGLFVLVECILVLTDANGRRFGDKFANTQVVVSDD